MSDNKYKKPQVVFLYCVGAFGVGFAIGSLIYNLMRK